MAGEATTSTTSSSAHPPPPAAALPATRQDIQAAIAKATELRALHAALLQGGASNAGGYVAYGGAGGASRSPSALIRLPPGPSPALSKAAVAEDYPVLTPDGRLLCALLPTYGNGEEAGNEENYIVGMSNCYPKPGSIKVTDGKVMTIVSNYRSDHQHTGVMGLFYIIVAEQEQPAPKPALCFSFPVPCELNKISPWVLAFMADQQSLNVEVKDEL
ncbi:hypothetical protein E2562_020499 [Oryza meyeriana var. granulata]|uniref:Uncharacterized protein n=1 Tax=Oryza meyeriana var. granulata TaxID=110450 RepID=A0A6G1D5Z1_9ORYZ|nr:hypothetical protein E2562_020499 [Oryza meyeriana var. granulata]